MAAKYLVEYRRDETGWWQARVPTIKGCHTQGRTVDEARKRIREALSLFVEDAAHATLVDDVKLPAVAARTLRAFLASKREAASVQSRLSMATRRAVERLHQGNLGLSTRDTAHLLGLSHQRVSQLARGTRRRVPPRRNTRST